MSDSPITMNLDISLLIEKWENEIVQKIDTDKEFNEEAVNAIKKVFHTPMDSQQISSSLKQMKGSKYIPILLNTKSTARNINEYHAFRNTQGLVYKSLLTNAYVKLSTK
eukprot:NODE_5_length_72347_cov_1.339331.p57 type:complete len:109 gc:universal NODE_5_length_72347_cov_1.339331:63444-63118(-)